MKSPRFIQKPLAIAAVGALCAVLVAPLSVSAQTIDRVKLTDNDLTCSQIYLEAEQMDGIIRSGSAAVAAAPPPAAVPDGLASLFGNLPVPGAAPAAAQAVVPQGLMPNQIGVPAALMSDPKVQASVARARAAGYSDAQIAAAMQVGAARAGYPVGTALRAQQDQQSIAAGQRPLSAAAGGNTPQVAMGILAQGQAHLANQGAPAAAPAAPAAPAAGLLGAFGAAMQGRGGGNSGAGMFGALMGGLAQQQQPAAVPQPVAPAPVAVAPAAPSGGALAAQAQARKDHLTQMFLSRGCKLSDVQK